MKKKVSEAIRNEIEAFRPRNAAGMGMQLHADMVITPFQLQAVLTRIARLAATEAVSSIYYRKEFADMVGRIVAKVLGDDNE